MNAEARKELEQSEAVRLLNLGGYFVAQRMKSTNLELGVRVRAMDIGSSPFTVTTEYGTPARHVTELPEPVSYIRLEHDGRIVVMGEYMGDNRFNILAAFLPTAYSDDFVSELNASHKQLRNGQFSPGERKEREAAIEAAKPLADMVCGRSVTGVEAIVGCSAYGSEQYVDGYILTLDDGTRVEIDVTTVDWEVAGLSIGDPDSKLHS